MTSVDQVVVRYEVRGPQGAIVARYSTLNEALLQAETINAQGGGVDSPSTYTVIETYVVVPVGQPTATWGNFHSVY